MLEVKETEDEELSSEMKESNDSCPWVQRRKMSSIYRAHSRGWRVWLERKVFSRWPMKRLAYEGAMRVPMAVPFV